MTSKPETATALPESLTLFQSINLRLALLGCPTLQAIPSGPLQQASGQLLARSRETNRLLANYLCPADWRIQQFLTEYLYDVCAPARLPSTTFVLDQPGLARSLSLPPDSDEFVSDLVSSYRLRNGVLHNPAKDRRTTAGVFHVTEGGLPIPDDKLGVPAATFGKMLQAALHPPKELLRLPITATQKEQAECFVSLLIRPIVCPEVAGYCKERTMEMRFFAPVNLVSNLDFVESIFGNAGDPFLPENDAGLDVEQWTGHTGCVILAPHLVTVKKKDVGLPHWDRATERQRRDGMCWKTEDELYNNGSAFKLTARDEKGVMVTIIADNYFGYCKKEVKTQISYAANLMGLSEEEHAGGALVFPSYDLGEEYSGQLHAPKLEYSFDAMIGLHGDLMEIHPEGYAVDRTYSDILYVPEHAGFDLRTQRITWEREGVDRSIKLLPGRTYVRPSGYRIHMEKPPGNRSWRLVGTVAEPTYCHKPCTVSGGGKSEISKAISDAIIQGPVFVADSENDFSAVGDILKRDFSDRFRDTAKNKPDSRPILSVQRSLGSVIKLLTPSSLDYTDEYNAWLRSIPTHIKELVYVVKRYYEPEWGDNWLSHFSVDILNGVPANELKCEGRKLAANHLRVGYQADGSWRVFGLRKDFHPAAKLQMEDDISASTVVPVNVLNRLNPEYSNHSVKFVANAETRLFQRPDDAILPGYDHQTELDMSQPGNFLSNYAPLTRIDAQDLMDDAIDYVKFTDPMANLIAEAAAGGPGPKFFVCNSKPRIVEGKPTKNPRYLQIRSDIQMPREKHLAEVSLRLRRRVPSGDPVHTPVNAVLPGRRNNPPDRKAGIPPLAVFSPIHFMELPEAFLEFTCSMTGKSPSTTGAGSEGALTKGPFNALPPILDLNDALVSSILTGADVFVTSAGYIGPKVRVDHDVSLIVPEVWSRMGVAERDPKFLIEEKYLEPVPDFDHNGKKVHSSRLGYRITARFVRAFFGRVFYHPHAVFTDEMLRPELQCMDTFAEGMDVIVTTQKMVAAHYFNDGGIDLACPPLKALLHIMRDDHYEGKRLDHPEIRGLFKRETVVASDWYQARLVECQSRRKALWNHHIGYIEQFLAKPNYADEASRLDIQGRLDWARKEFNRVSSPAYTRELVGTIGVSPLK
jgi:phosphoenolpyruvate carboxykinase (diphosphate)